MPVLERKKNCTDTEPLYDEICRYNDYWNTEEGLAKAGEYYETMNKDI